MTKNVVSKYIPTNLWSDGTRRTWPEPAPDPEPSTFYRNPYNEAAAYLQGNTVGNGVQGSATARAECGWYDVIVLQWKWLSSQSAETTYMGQLRTAHPHLKILMYTDDQYWFDSAESSTDDTTHANWLALSSAGAPMIWRSRLGDGTQLGHGWSGSDTKTINWTQAMTGNVNTAGKTLTDAVYDAYDNYFQADLYDGFMLDDQNIIGHLRVLRSGGSSVDWDYDGDGTNDARLSDATFKDVWATQQRAKFDRLRVRYPNAIFNINTDPTFWYRQTDSGGCPERPFSAHPYYQTDDVAMAEGMYSFNGGWSNMSSDGDTTQTYILKSFFSLQSLFMGYEHYRQISRPIATNRMGRPVAFGHQQLTISDTATPSLLTYAFARTTWAISKLVAGGYGTVRSGTVPFGIDELAIDLGGAPTTTDSMGTLNESAAPVTFTLRAPNQEVGSADFHWIEYPNTLVVVRTDITGLTPGSSFFGDGSAVTCTLPSAGVGFRWDEYDSTNFVHPTIASLAMRGQDVSVNGGATNITTWAARPLYGKAFRRVAI